MKTTIFIKTIIKLLYMKTIFKQIISILLISTILGVFNNYFISNNRVDLIKYQRSVDTVIEGDFSIPNLMTEPQIVKTDFIKYYIDNSTATIIDARDKEQYDELHIRGSISIPYNSYESSDVLYDLPVENIYIIYCNGGDCTLSLDLAYIMFDEFDFETVFVYEEGISLWEGKGYLLSSNIDDTINSNKDSKIDESDSKLSKLVINVGRSNRITPEIIIKLINKTTRTRDVNIGKIDIKKKYSTFEVDSSMKDIIFSKMKDIRIGRTKIIVSDNNQNPIKSPVNKKKFKKRKRRVKY